MNKKPLTVGALCELSIFAGGRIEKYNVRVVEIVGAAIARVQINGGGIIRVVSSQLRVL